MQRKNLIHLDKLVVASPDGGYGLKIVVIYEDDETRQWAREVYERAAKIGGDSVRATWWRIGELSSPGVLAGAVSTAIRADAILVATNQTGGLPLPFYIWVKQWLPHRGNAGALIALLGNSGAEPTKANRVETYLRGIAEVGRLEFLVERKKFEERALARTNGVSRKLPVVNGNGHPHPAVGRRASKTIAALPDEAAA